VSIIVSGAVVSTNQVNVAGVASTLPARSIALTSNVWLVSERPGYVAGLVHAANPPPSSWHSVVLPASVAWNANVADVWLVGLAGVLVIDGAGGGAVSTTQVKLAGVASVLPAASVAVTVNVWLPAARPLYEAGLVQAAAAPPSRTHWNVEPASVEWNVKEAEVELVGLVGPLSITVSGATVSTVQV